MFHSLFLLHAVKGFGIVNKAEIDAFLELSCFFNDPTDVGSLMGTLKIIILHSLAAYEVYTDTHKHTHKY